MIILPYVISLWNFIPYTFLVNIKQIIANQIDFHIIKKV